MNLDELLLAVTKLNNLLADPHPGLITWCDALSDAMQRVNNAYHAKYKA